MIWIIQKCSSDETGWNRLYAEVLKLGARAIRLDLEELKEIENKNAPHIIIGGDDFLQEAKSLHINICEDVFGTEAFFNNERYVSEFGDDFLNSDSVKLSLSDLEKYSGNYFIRPYCDTKCFDGKIYRLPDEAEALRKIKCSCVVNLDGCFCLASPKKIEKEWRAVIVSGKIASVCSYLENGEIRRSNSNIPAPMLAFCQGVINSKNFPTVFVIDIALTASSYKVVECNLFNVSNLYECDYSAVVLSIQRALETYKK